ncbi:B-cell receptor CD22-like [Colossoma macropomum]|uniref:B-cell receptor CD22-like n=1 Tax=Colossoma macropomum TaxID=42526 RepID=UPI001863DC23|nr:B-cell receptor CD22-like [Colossoma macropomum]
MSYCCCEKFSSALLIAGLRTTSEEQWGVTYTPERVCALKGSSVNFSCTYKHPEGLTVTKSLWFIESQWERDVEPVDVGEYNQYKGRVQYSQTLNHCRMTITDLRESDAHTYKFRFYTDDPDGIYSGRPGVTLSVTGLKVTVSDTDGGVKKLTCSSTCTLPNPTYIWYKNRQPVFNQNRNELNLRDRTVDAGSYSCAVKGYEELRSPAVCVFDKVLQLTVEGPVATASEGQTVTLTCSSTCTLPSRSTYIWYKNRQPVSQCESASCSVAVVSEAVNYSCAVKGSALHSPPVCEYRFSHALIIFSSPKNTRAVILPSGQRVEGDSVTLTCSSDANPPVLSYYWFNQSSDVVLGTGQNYSITSISSQHSGLYYCTAHNQLGQSSSGPSRLDVLYSPRPPSVSEIGFNGSVRLVCISDSNPASSYTWFRKIGGDITQFGEGANLTLAAGTDGVFYCMAENQLGSSNSSEWTFTSAGLWKQFAVWGTVGFVSALVLFLIIAVLCIWRKRGAERGADVQPVRDSPSDTYSALNPETRTSDNDTLTVVRPHPVMRRAPENEN